MKIAGLQRVSLIDYPDRIAATVFIAGCNLNCGFCHNRWMLDAGDVDEAMSPATLLAWLRGRTGKLEGICITGGEPLLAPELPTFIAEIKALGFLVKLDTNGCFPGRLAALLADNRLDYVAMDVKAPLDERYEQAAGMAVDLDRLGQSMTLLRNGAVPWEFRTTVHPLLDAPALVDIAQSLRSDDHWVLQPFMPLEGVLASVRERAYLSIDDLRAQLPALRQIVPGVRLRAA